MDTLETMFGLRPIGAKGTQVGNLVALKVADHKSANVVGTLGFHPRNGSASAHANHKVIGGNGKVTAFEVVSWLPSDDGKSGPTILEAFGTLKVESVRYDRKVWVDGKATDATESVVKVGAFGDVIAGDLRITLDIRYDGKDRKVTGNRGVIAMIRKVKAERVRGERTTAPVQETVDGVEF